MYKFQLFGSKSSIDYDAMVFIESIPDSVEVCKSMCEIYDKEIFNILISHNYPIKKVNSNLAVVENGVLTDIHKGMICECNNSLYLTYNNFEQIHPNQITKLVDRDVDLKILRCYRILLSFLSRTYHREEVKKALKGTLTQKIDVLININFDNIDFGNRNGEPIDIWKALAFQVGQTLLLTDNIEVYSKEEICIHIPSLSSFIMRRVDYYDYVLFKQYLVELSNYILVNKIYLLGHNENSWNY
jgi:hypothetical protein